MTKYPDLFGALAAQFDPHEVRSRTQAGRQMHYITARTAMNRLDSTLGPENWWDEYVPGENSVLCRLSVRLPDGTVLTKSDAGGYAGMPDQGDDDKSGYSDSFKRAAVKFGVGRYLYRDGVANLSGDEPATDQPPREPAREPETHQPSQQPRQEQRSQERPPAGPQDGNGRGNGKSVPRSGRALFAWVKEQEQRHEVSLLKYLNGWAKLQDFPGRMVDWDNAQVDHAYGEAIRKLQSLRGQGDAYEEALEN